MKYIEAAGRGMRSAGRLRRERLLAHNPRCWECGLDLVEMNLRRLRLYQAYGVTARRLNLHNPLPADLLHPVTQAVRNMGFDHCRPHEPLAAVDHRIPLWAGGSDEDDNCQILCQPCHKEKTSDEAGQRKRLRGRPWAS